MSKNTALEERVKTLEKEVERLEKVNEALMRRVERSTDAAGAQKKLKKHPDELGEAEQELKLYKRVFMASGDAILIHDHPEGKIIAKNPAYQRIVGTSEEENISDHIKNMIDEGSRKKLEQSMKETGTFRGELKIQAKDGMMYYVDMSEFPITNDAGDLTYSVAIARDVTERKQAEEKLKLYRRIFITTNDGVAIVDPEGRRLIDCNPALLRYMGISKKEVPGKPISTLFDEDTYAEVIQAISEKDSYRGEVVFRHEDGVVYFVDLSIYPIRNEENVLICYVGMGRDITQRKQDQEALATRLRYETGLAACSNALLKTGDSDEVVPKALRFLLEAADAGRAYVFENFEDPSDGLCTKPRWEVCAPGVAESIANPLLQHLSYEEVLPSWRETLAENKVYGGLTRDLSPGVQEILRAQGVLSILVLPIWVNEEWYGFIGFDDVKQEREWGEETAFEYEIRLLRTAADMIGGYLARHHALEALRSSLEELEKAHRHLKETQAQLVQSGKMASLGMLVAGIAHEINTPIGSVSSMHDTLMRATDKLRDVLEVECAKDSPNYKKIRSILKIIGDANRVIQTGTERVTTIVRRLRSFARLDEAELKEADIHEGLEDTLTLIHHEIKHNIEVHRNYGDISPIPCYMARLNQVFVNLLINSKHAIKGKGEITITTYEREGKVFIDFTDTGTGIPRNDLKRIFDPGFTTKGVGVGTGLGLSICYQIMQDHYGEILVESEVGKGTTFTLVIPIHLDEILGVS